MANKQEKNRIRKLRSSFYLSQLNCMCAISSVQFGQLSMNSTANASSEFWNCATLFSSKAFIGGTVALCLITVVSLVGNSLIVMLVYKTTNLRKPINYFIANMASSDLLFILFRGTQRGYTSKPLNIALLNVF